MKLRNDSSDTSTSPECFLRRVHVLIFRFFTVSHTLQ